MTLMSEDKENTTVVAKIPEIKIWEPKYWQDLEAKYRKKHVVKNGGLHFTETFFYVAHVQNRSKLLHSLIGHLANNREYYAKRYSFEFWLIKAAILDGFFGLRECLSALINSVFQLGVDCSKKGSTLKVMKEAKRKGLSVGNDLEQTSGENSILNKYLEEFRHPYVHREDLSSFTVQDITASLVGAEQPRIGKFIDRSLDTSEWLRGIEKKMADECGKQLGIK